MGASSLASSRESGALGGLARAAVGAPPADAPPGAAGFAGRKLRPALAPDATQRARGPRAGEACLEGTRIALAVTEWNWAMVQ